MWQKYFYTAKILNLSKINLYDKKNIYITKKMKLKISSLLHYWDVINLDIMRVSFG